MVIMEGALLNYNEEVLDTDSSNEIEESDNSVINTDSSNEYDEDTKTINSGWADSIAKILKTNKPKGKKTLVLSKAKKITDANKTAKSVPSNVEFEVDGEIKEEKLDPDSKEIIKDDSGPPKKKKKKEIQSVRVKPNILEKDRERTLSKIATKGVVQLFNAVRMQQNDFSKKLKQAGPLERKKEQVLKNFDKRNFLDVLMGEKSMNVDSSLKEDVKDDEETNLVSNENRTKESESTWNVLRDDFMMGAKLKDWDKEASESEVEVETVEMSDSD